MCYVNPESIEQVSTTLISLIQLVFYLYLKSPFI